MERMETMYTEQGSDREVRSQVRARGREPWGGAEGLRQEPKGQEQPGVKHLIILG